jgi:hypothetical protein
MAQARDNPEKMGRIPSAPQFPLRYYLITAPLLPLVVVSKTRELANISLQNPFSKGLGYQNP